VKHGPARLARFHVERAEVQRAFDDVVFEDALGEARRPWVHSLSVA
jgi:hypothetical protein